MVRVTHGIVLGSAPARLKNCIGPSIRSPPPPQGNIAYAAVAQERLSSKKRAYTVFGEIAEAESAKANREEVRRWVQGGRRRHVQSGAGDPLQTQLGMHLLASAKRNSLALVRKSR